MFCALNLRVHLVKAHENDLSFDLVFRGVEESGSDRVLYNTRSLRLQLTRALRWVEEEWLCLSYGDRVGVMIQTLGSVEERLYRLGLTSAVPSTSSTSVLYDIPTSQRWAPNRLATEVLRIIFQDRNIFEGEAHLETEPNAQYRFHLTIFRRRRRRYDSFRTNRGLVCVVQDTGSRH
jgi:hypothetical protein